MRKRLLNNEIKNGEGEWLWASLKYLPVGSAEVNQEKISIRIPGQPGYLVKLYLATTKIYYYYYFVVAVAVADAAVAVVVVAVAVVVVAAAAAAAAAAVVKQQVPL